MRMHMHYAPLDADSLSLPSAKPTGDGGAVCVLSFSRRSQP